MVYLESDTERPGRGDQRPEIKNKPFCAVEVLRPSKNRHFYLFLRQMSFKTDAVFDSEDCRFSSRNKLF